jgi:hypothetical protein
MATTIPISGLNPAACTLALPGSGLPLPGLPAGFATVRLAKLWTGGTFIHWVTIVNFIDYRLFPSLWACLGATVAGLARALVGSFPPFCGAEYMIEGAGIRQPQRSHHAPLCTLNGNKNQE